MVQREISYVIVYKIFPYNYTRNEQPDNVGKIENRVRIHNRNAIHKIRNVLPLLFYNNKSNNLLYKKRR